MRATAQEMPHAGCLCTVLKDFNMIKIKINAKFHKYSMRK